MPAKCVVRALHQLYAAFPYLHGHMKLYLSVHTSLHVGSVAMVAVIKTKAACHILIFHTTQLFSDTEFIYVKLPY